MTYSENTHLPTPTANPSPVPDRRVNWHEAVACAIQIELRDFADILEFYTEYALDKNKYRIDMLVIKRLSDQPIPKNIARCFTTYNVFETKGIHSSITLNAYYKTIAYASLLLYQISTSEQYTRMEVSITFPCFHYPRKLIKHLRKNALFSIEKFSDGIYYINNEPFKIQIIVIPELPPDENLYLRCLTDNLQDDHMINRLAKDYAMHQGQTLYNKYMHQLTNANLQTKGESLMVANEWIFKLFGTSSDEIIARAKQESQQELDEYYQPKINALADENAHLTSSIKQLTSQNEFLRNLLMQHNISYE
ncbi:MAG: hypothetical protein NC489_31680 [Ruminococcus flavefaciens]|nr:hypothetical protein [Ruminococcus flavefaciens]